MYWQLQKGNASNISERFYYFIIFWLPEFIRGKYLYFFQPRHMWFLYNLGWLCKPLDLNAYLQKS